MPANEPAHVVVVGGGITGLSAAFALEQARQSAIRPFAYTLIEAQSRLGGNVRTDRIDGYVIEAGPDGFVASKPHAAALCRAVGLGDRLIETVPASRRLYVVHRRRLVPFPEGVALIAPTRALPILRSPLFSATGKARMLLDLLLPPRTGSLDESIADFVGRRLGPEAVEILAEPLLAGIHAGDPSALSIDATFPQIRALERDHGGLIRGARATRRPHEGQRPPSAFLSLRGGMDELVDALERKLAPGTVRTSTSVTGLNRGGPRRWRLVQDDGNTLDADAVLLALPAHACAALLELVDGDLASSLREIPHLGTASVYLGYDRDAISHPLDASGFVVPRREGLRINAATWASCKWPDRAPEGKVLIRVFLGGARDPAITDASDEAIVAIASEQLGALLGVRAPPTMARLYRYPRANPQMTVGHRTRLAHAHERLARLGGIWVAGAGHQGVGVPDCARQGEASAGAVLAYLADSRTR